MILHAHISGEGEPIVLLHSGGMTGLVEYEEQAALFGEQNYQVIRPDLRGHGKSGGTLENYFLRSVKDLYDTLEHLQIDRCHIAGVSLGGLVALLFAKKVSRESENINFFRYISG